MLNQSACLYRDSVKEYGGDRNFITKRQDKIYAEYYLERCRNYCIQVFIPGIFH